MSHQTLHLQTSDEYFQNKSLHSRPTQISHQIPEKRTKIIMDSPNRTKIIVIMNIFLIYSINIYYFTLSLIICWVFFSYMFLYFTPTSCICYSKYEGTNYTLPLRQLRSFDSFAPNCQPTLGNLICYRYLQVLNVIILVLWCFPFLFGLITVLLLSVLVIVDEL